MKQRKDFANYLQKSQKYKIQVVDGIDSGGEDGIYIHLQNLKQCMK